MKLSEWLTQQKITQTEFAKMINSDQGHVSDLVRGKVKPKLATMEIVLQVTEGQVTFVDWSEAKKPEPKVEKPTSRIRRRIRLKKLKAAVSKAAR